MKPPVWTLALVAILALVLLACGLHLPPIPPITIPTPPAATPTPSPTPSASPTPQPTPAPTPTPEATPTPGPSPSPTPAPGAKCLPDQGTWVLASNQSSAYVKADGSGVLAELIVSYQRAHPEAFTDGGARLADRSAAGVDRFYDSLGALAATSGLCAGHVYNDGSRGDMFGMREADGRVSDFHIVEYGGFRLQRPLKVNSVWAPSAGGPPVTQPTPPAQNPQPQPTATPAAGGACPAPRPEAYRNPATKQDCTFSWGLVVGRQWIDATLTVTRCCQFCAAIGMGQYGDQQRCTCPLRPEGHPDRAVCEAEAGALWQVRPAGGTLEINPENPVQARCSGPGCQAHVCTTNPVFGAAGACSEWKP